MLTSILLDQREPQHILNLTFGSADKLITLLEQGDALAVCADDRLLCIERKTPDDLLASIQDGRLLHQAAHLTDLTPWAYLIVTGPLLCSSKGTVITPRGETGWQWSSVQGALLTVQELGVFVLFAESDLHYEQLILSLANRNRESLPLWPARPPKFLSAGEAMLASLPGIGQEKLDAVLKVYATPADALAWLTNPHAREKVPGLGPGIRANIRQALQLAEHEYLMVTSEPPAINGGNHVSDSN